MANAQFAYFLPTHRGGRYLCVIGYLFLVNMRKIEEYISWKCAKKDCISIVSTTKDKVTKMPLDYIFYGGHSCSPSHKSRFKKACKEKNLQEVERLVGQGLLDVNCRFEEASTPVMFAASYNWTRAFDYLVQQNCDLTTNNSNSMTVLHFASGNSEEITRKLIDDHCSDIECRDLSGQTPLTHAASTEHVQIAQLLVDRGADSRVVDKVNRNILHVASNAGHVNMVKYILSLNVIDIDGKGESGTTALMYAVRKDHVPVVKVLLQHNADVTKLDGYKDNVLHLAVSYSHLDMVMIFASMKETLGFEKRGNFRGLTPFRLAEVLGKADITSFFKSRTN